MHKASLASPKNDLIAYTYGGTQQQSSSNCFMNDKIFRLPPTSGHLHLLNEYIIISIVLFIWIISAQLKWMKIWIIILKTKHRLFIIVTIRMLIFFILSLFHTIDLKNNILTGQEINFEKSGAEGTELTAYDYGSIMHYPRWAFSDWFGDTIEPLDPSVEIGQREKLSECDIEKVQVHYGCKPKVNVSQTNILICFTKVCAYRMTYIHMMVGRLLLRHGHIAIRTASLSEIWTVKQIIKINQTLMQPGDICLQ